MMNCMDFKKEGGREYIRIDLHNDDDLMDSNDERKTPIYDAGVVLSSDDHHDPHCAKF